MIDLDFGELVMFPAEVVSKIQKEHDYQTREKHRKARRAWKTGYIPMREREFIAWDGEGYTAHVRHRKNKGCTSKCKHHYMLLANSVGDYIVSKSLGTIECLDKIIQCGLDFPNHIHIWFGGNYDTSMILKDLSERFFRILKMFNTVTWQGYQIEHIPHKWFRVRARGVDVKIFDIQSFFACSFEKALTDWNIGPWKDLTAGVKEIVLQKRFRNIRIPTQKQLSTMSETQIVHIFKQLRGIFGWQDIQQVTLYNQIELKYLVQLCDSLREVFTNAGFNLQSWHGPGALARHALNRHQIKNSMCVTPPDVQIASCQAFAGGRFELPRGGYFEQRIYNADKRSAYPYYASLLPNLARGSWRRVARYQPGLFGIYNISYQAKQELGDIFPLFRRDKEGHVEWPNRVEGWYWNPEAELVADDPNATFLGGWVFDEDNPGDRPFAWINEYYEKRQFLQSIGNPAEFTFKLCINSIYGQLAQRTGWDKKHRKPPRYHQLEWAGWITSACRADLYKVAKACGDKLISIDTDGLYSLAPIQVQDIGYKLGQWEVKEYDAGVFWQSGMYALRSGNTWIKAKTRGIPKGTYEPEDLIRCIESGKPLTMTKSMFIGYGLALNGRWNELNTWQTPEKPTEFLFGGQGKRAHNEVGCRNGKTCKDGIHLFVPVPHRIKPSDTMVSQPHYLPWLHAGTEMRMQKEAYFDLVAFDANDDDPEERWIIDECNLR